MPVPPAIPEPPPIPKKPSGLRAWHYVVIALGALLALGVLALGVIGHVGPDSAVLAGSRLKPWHRAAVRRIAGLDSNETIRFFYSSALLHIDQDGNLLTDRAVYSYYADGGSTVVERAAFPEIADADISYGAGLFEDSTLTVTLTNDESIILLLSRERQGDRRFYEALRSELAGRKAER